MKAMRMALAYSYLRFSHPDQADGDSVRRQTQATADWCQRHGAQLDQSLVLVDQGRSAFKRVDFDTYALAEFLRHVETGRVQQGSYLVVENLDRLSRECEVDAAHLFTGLLKAGVNVVQLTPREQVYTRQAGLGDLFTAIAELSRGHSESVRKQSTMGPVWAEKKRRAAAGELVTRKLPGWMRVGSDGRPALVRERAAVVRRIFEMAIAGIGVYATAQRLNAEGVPSWRRPRKANREREAARQWNETAVYAILTSPATYGTYQPHQGSRNRGRGGSRPVGDPVPNYYPAAVRRETFEAAAGGRARRRTLAADGRLVGKGGRVGRRVNPFSGLLKTPDGDSLTVVRRPDRSPYLAPVGAVHGTGAAWTCFNADIFEAAMLKELAEVRAADVLPGKGSARKVEHLAARLAEAEALYEKWKAKMDDPGIVDVVAAKLTELGAKRKKLAEELADAQCEAASPAGEAWGQFKSLAGAVEKGGDQVRERLRAVLRRTVEGIRLLILPPVAGRARHAVAQVFFFGGAWRVYSVKYLQTRSNGKITTPGKWWSYSFTDRPKTRSERISLTMWGGLDLRDPEQAAAFAEYLEATTAV